MEKAFTAYPKTISYLKKTESNYLYNGNKGKVETLIGKKINKNKQLTIAST